MLFVGKVLKEISELRIYPARGLNLSSFDADNTFGKSQDDLDRELPRLRSMMSDQQYKLYVENEKSLLIVLQGMDTSGKDGVIRHVMSAFNPVSCTVVSFKVPTSEELAHDFLWRVHKVVPRKGFLAVFNRSHYEDVVEARVQNLVSESICFQRFVQIKQFEIMLAQNRMKILKFFLHISKQEQKKRLRDRLSDPEKRWKVNKEDYEKRKKWGLYMSAYTDAIIKCSIREAPWYVIPANKKWFRNWLVSKIITNALVEMKIKFPKSAAHYKNIKI
ncbi:MAG TPA: PPK2 family polyphosphate kinase [Nitrososphaeraceae archaeon]|jgi:PPK2 family polyphosphate:nucleotide phosphotransferase|nr:PPK2 family polyphosphate kinase [Nitrososphaeraceae archaeon]